MIKNKSKVVMPRSIKIPEELTARAKIVEERTGATFSGIVRVALSRYLDEVLSQKGA